MPVKPHRSGSCHALWPYVVLGLLQGLAMWLLQYASPTLPGHWLNAWQGLAVALPLAWYLGDHAPGAWRKRVVVALAVGLLVALVGALQETENQALYGRADPGLVPMAIVAFVLVTLSAGFAEGRRLWYARLFEHAWRNAFALPLAALLSGIWWMLLWAAAWLMKSIGLPGMEALLRQPGFVCTVGCTAFGLSMGAVLGRSDALPTLRRFWLNMNSCFLPVALGFAAIWLVALMFTGVSPLFETRKAATLLFWFCTITVVFANAAFQDGHDAPVLPAPMAWLAPYCAWAWLTIPVLAGLGDWALWLRVQQYGWTVDRVWAAAVGLLVTLYGLGYALSALAVLSPPPAGRRRCWMSTLPATNVAVAMVKVVVLLLLLTPLANSRRIAMDSQVRRLLNGQETVATFDWAYLQRNGAHGQRALQRLASLDATDPDTRPIAQRAATELHHRARSLAPMPETVEARLQVLRELEVLPTGNRIDPALLQWLARPDADDEERRCQQAAQPCVFALFDLDGDGVREAFLLADRGARVQPVLYAREPDGWKRQGLVMGAALPMATWRAALQDGTLKTAPPAWPLLLLDGQRLEIRP